MDDQTPQTPPPDERPDADDPTPDPHRTEPAPRPQEGTRPGTDDAIRPEQDEPLGPLAGLVTAAGAKVSDEASAVAGDDDPEAEALLARMGVEDEGIEGGQLLGLVAATLVAVAVLAGTLIYALYVPYRTTVGQREAGQLDPQELAVIRTEGQTKILQYGRTDSTYQIPIERAMGLVAAEYASGAGVERTRQQWNTVPVYQAGMGRAVQAAAAPGAMSRDSIPMARPAVESDEEVGVDVVVPPVQVVETDDDAIE